MGVPSCHDISLDESSSQHYQLITTTATTTTLPSLRQPTHQINHKSKVAPVTVSSSPAAAATSLSQSQNGMLNRRAHLVHGKSMRGKMGRSSSMSHVLSSSRPLQQEQPLSTKKSSSTHSHRRGYLANILNASSSHIVNTNTECSGSSSEDLSYSAASSTTTSTLRAFPFEPTSSSSPCLISLSLPKLLDQIQHEIAEQTAQRASLRASVNRHLELAQARYWNGSILGAILAMRRVHVSRKTKAYVSGARYQLIALKHQIKTYLLEKDDDNDEDDDANDDVEDDSDEFGHDNDKHCRRRDDEEQQQVRNIYANFQSTMREITLGIHHCGVTQNDESLLNELKSFMHLEATPSLSLSLTRPPSERIEI